MGETRKHMLPDAAKRMSAVKELHTVLDDTGCTAVCQSLASLTVVFLGADCGRGDRCA